MLIKLTSIIITLKKFKIAIEGKNENKNLAPAIAGETTFRNKRKTNVNASNERSGRRTTTQLIPTAPRGTKNVTLFYTDRAYEISPRDRAFSPRYRRGTYTYAVWQQQTASESDIPVISSPGGTSSLTR